MKRTKSAVLSTLRVLHLKRIRRIHVWRENLGRTGSASATDLVENLRTVRASTDPDCPWVFPSQTGRVSYHFLERLKRIAWRAGLNCRMCRGKKNIDCRTGPHCTGSFLHKFRATYATNQLRAGTDIRTLQVWMGHKDLASTMRYLKAGHGKDLLEKVNAAFAVGAGM